MSLVVNILELANGETSSFEEVPVREIYYIVQGTISCCVVQPVWIQVSLLKLSKSSFTKFAALKTDLFQYLIKIYSKHLDLVWTASVALILSFFVAKLVAIAMADREPEPSEFKSTKSAGDGEKLRVEEVYQSQRSVQLQFAAAQVQEVDRFEVKPVEEAVGVAEKSYDGEKVSVEKAVDSDRRRGHEDEEIWEDRQVDAQSARNDVVTAHEAVEVKSGSYSDEDDWEGIEKSEVDEGYTAAVKSEGG